MSTVSFHADYPEYDSLSDLEADSNIVVEVEFTGKTRTELLKEVAPEDSSDPKQNPELGVMKKPSASQARPIVTTVHEARVINVVDGAAKVGQLIEVQEMGGVYQGVSYVPDDDTSLRTDRANLLFLTRVSSGEPYQLLNPMQAVYPESSAGVPEPHPENEIDVTTSELVEYIG